MEYLCDGGADYTIINRELFEKIKTQAPRTVLKPYRGKPLTSCTSEIKVLGIIQLERCIIDPNVELDMATLIVTDHKATQKCILDRDILYKVPELRHHMKAMKNEILDWSMQLERMFFNGKRSVCPEPKRSKHVEELKSAIMQLSLMVESKYPKIIHLKAVQSHKGSELEPCKRAKRFETKLEPIEEEKTEMEIVRQEAYELLEKQSATSLADLQPHKNSRVAFKIRLLDPYMRPIRCRVRPLAYHLKEKVKKTLDEQEAAGIIRKSYSEWGSALRVVHKTDGSIRITVDYKPLNAVIKGDVYPLPNIAEIYKKLSDSGIFSKIDLKAAYHQIPMEEQSIELTAFTCEFGLYEYLSMPMGIKNAPAWFQRFMEETFRDFIERRESTSRLHLKC